MQDLMILDCQFTPEIGLQYVIMLCNSHMEWLLGNQTVIW